MTVNQLIEKYPLIFAPYKGNPGSVNWLDIPDAWIPVIDDLCGSIQRHIDYVRRYQPNPGYVEGSVYNPDDITTHKSIEIKPNQVTCIQMKEKYGGLRFYASNADETVEGMIDMAEYICNNICQSCGTRENLGITNGWISICCKECYDADKGGTGDWKPKSIVIQKSH